MHFGKNKPVPLPKHRDGRWRLEMIPLLAGKLASRILSRGQQFVVLPPQNDYPRPCPEQAKRKTVASQEKGTQTEAEGSGAFYYRRYTVDFTSPQFSALELMQKIKSDPNTFSPQSLAVYRKTRGPKDTLELGDEFFIEMTGPWNGPVRVELIDSYSFTFVTLQDHMEAGQIQFSVREKELAPPADGIPRLRFQIQSWARSRDFIVDLAYDKLQMAKMVQAEMWTSYAENIVHHAQGKQIGPVTIATQRKPVTDSSSGHYSKNK